MMDDEGFDTDENDYLMRPRGIRGPKKKSLKYYLTDGWKVACTKSVAQDLYCTTCNILYNYYTVSAKRRQTVFDPLSTIIFNLF